MKVKCDCKPGHAQDELCGKGLRWGTPKNKTKKDGVVHSWKCTVCGKIHDLRTTSK
jgi:hypothetical protein